MRSDRGFSALGKRNSGTGREAKR
ncbi:hypothetical protein LUTEI9C_10251 [Luteimonas sp. 9C]|nr:hypothetical protein LUTEI9C_10251 [Luteimonas sp. 9C]